jgi:shikimate kinase
MIGRAFCYGAASIVNAIPTGKGCAFGIKLKTVAEVKLTDEAGFFEVLIKNDPEESTELAKNCVSLVLDKFNLKSEYGARVTTASEIPISRGLKSSSTAANAIVLACYKALNKKYNDLEIINIGVDASLIAKTTITGAFDDACASYFSGAVVTDNTKRKILKRYKIEKDNDYEVIIYVPKRKIRKLELDLKKLKRIAKLSEFAFQLAYSQIYPLAMLVNTLAWNEYLDTTPEIELKALKQGALAASISGTGPSIAILAHKDISDGIIEDIKTENADIIRTKLNNSKKASYCDEIS